MTTNPDAVDLELDQAVKSITGPGHEFPTPQCQPESSPDLRARLTALETQINTISQHLLANREPLPTHYEEEEEEEEYSSDEAEPPNGPRNENPFQLMCQSKPVADIWAPQEVPDQVDEISFDPVVIQQEPDIPEPCPRIRAHLATCHRWGTEGWNRTQYKDTEKKLKHTGGFQPLLVNHQLANRGRDDFNLRQLERLLANIQYGIMAQREAFTQAANQFLKENPENKVKFTQIFMGQESEFRKTSQDLVQYTVGKRVEVIEQRRNQFIPKDLTTKHLLSQIPPSDSHLFAEQELSKHNLPPVPAAKRFSAAPKRKTTPNNTRALSSGPPPPKQARYSYTTPTNQYAYPTLNQNRGNRKPFPGSRREDRQEATRPKRTYPNKNARQRTQ